MTAGQKRKFYRNMEFERSSRSIGVASLHLLCLLGPIGVVLMVLFALLFHTHSSGHVLTAAAPVLGIVGRGHSEGVRLSGLNWNPGSDSELMRRALAPLRRRGGEFRSQRGFGPMRLKNEAPDNISSWRDGWYYDTASFAAGAAFAKTLFFAVPQSGNKFLNSTNLSGQGGQVPAGETLLVRSIRIYISNTTVPADFQNIISNVSVTFAVRNYPIYQCTPEFFPPGFGAATLAAAQIGTAPAGTTTVTSTSNGMPQQTAVYDLKTPYQLNSQESFAVILNPEVAFNMVAAAGVNPLGVGTTIRIYLEGNRQALLGG